VPVVRRRVVVHGRVQGVGFRFALLGAAETRNVAGWVRNRADGTVEAAFEGAAHAVDGLVRWCETGPRGALVERVDVVDEPPEGLSGFDVR
jgi:acylphosphatase